MRNSERGIEGAPSLDSPPSIPHSTFRIVMHRTSDFDYYLPPELIAQHPLPDRAASRLLVLDRSTGGIRHAQFRDIVELIAPEDVLVLNVSRVIPARLRGTRDPEPGWRSRDPAGPRTARRELARDGPSRRQAQARPHHPIRRRQRGGDRR